MYAITTGWFFSHTAISSAQDEGGASKYADVSTIFMAEGSLARQFSSQLSVDSGDGVGLELELLKNVYTSEMKLSRDER